MTKNEICKTFRNEFDKISEYNQLIIPILIDMLHDLPDDKFWTEPASSTGVHHPKTSNGIGGNVIHTKEAFWIADSILNTTKMQDDNKSYVLSAVLLHDIDKFTQSIDEHGITASKKILDYCESRQFNLQASIMISRCVMLHMGKWGKIKMDDNIFDMAGIVHLSDYLSSRPFLEFNESEVTK
jgi:hypothetical protein